MTSILAGVIGFFGSLFWMLSLMGMSKRSGVSWGALGLSGLAIGLAMLFLVLAARAEQAEKPRALRDEPEPRARPNVWWTAGPLALIVLQFVIAWAQFELYVDEIIISPYLGALAGIVLGLQLPKWVPMPRTFSSAAALGAVAIFGLPLGVLSVTLPTAHFREHGTSVIWPSAAEDEDNTYLEAQDRHAPAPTRTASAHSDLLHALANAKPVDMQAALESGAVVMKDGQLHTKNEDGTLSPILTGQAALDALDTDLKAAIAEDDAAHAKALATHAMQEELHRNGGRLFSSP